MTKPKQQHDVYGIKVLRKKHPKIKKLVKKLEAPVIHGHKTWSSSYVVMDYLEHYPLKRKSRVMEVGCGWGALSVFCASTFNAKVVAVDADKRVFPYLKVQAKANDVRVKTLKARFETLPKRKLAKQDYIFGSDICFWDELIDPLYTMIKRAMNAGVKEIIIADPGRSPFYKLAKRCKKRFHAEVIEWNAEAPEEAQADLLVIRPKAA